jgi:hypothetical protein
MLRVTALSGGFPRGQSLSLLLQHPIDTHADRVLVLQPDAQGWSAPWTVESGHDWILELTPANRNWRLQGRWLRAEAGARLQPSLRTTAEVGWNPRRDTLGLAPKWSNAVSTVHHATAETTLGGDPRDYAFRGVGSALRSESTSGDGHASR